MLTDLHPDSKIVCSHCGDGALTLKYVRALRELQYRVGPDNIILMTSGFRCLEYNRSKAVGSGDYSYHPKGMAGDLTCPTLNVIDLFLIAQEIPDFKGLGIYPDENFIHTDVRDNRKRFGYWKRDEKKIEMSPEDLQSFLID